MNPSEEQRALHSESQVAFIFPNAKSDLTGVSVKYAPDSAKHWFVIRASYGRVQKAANLLIEEGVYHYVPKKYAERIVHGKRVRYLKPLIPNLLFVYASPGQMYELVRNTPKLHFISFYYNHFDYNEFNRNPPLTVPDFQMEALVKATVSANEHLLFLQPGSVKFKTGDIVRVIAGAFTGVEGKVARVAGQQRVVVTLTDIGLVATAYIPSQFLAPV